MNGPGAVGGSSSPALGTAIALALEALRDLSAPPAAVLDGRIEHLLRTSLAGRRGASDRTGSRDTGAKTRGAADGSAADGSAAREGAADRGAADLDPHGRAGPAVLAACAHLGAGDLEDAYLALCTARTYLPTPGLADTGDPSVAGQPGPRSPFPMPHPTSPSSTR